MKKEMTWKNVRYKDEKKLHDWFKHMKEVDDWIEKSPKAWARAFFLKWNTAFLFFNDNNNSLMAEFMNVRDQIVEEYETWKTKTEEE